MIIPKRHDQNHTLVERLVHVGHTTMLLERIGVAKDLLLLITKLGGNGISLDTGNGRLGVGNDFPVLDVVALDFHVVASANKLSDDGEFLGSVDGLALAVKGLVTLAVRVEIATIGITGSAIAVGGIGSTAAVALAAGLADGLTGVRSNCSTHGVGLPDIHLGAAGPVLSDTGIGVVGGSLPAFDVALIVISIWLSNLSWVYPPRH